MPVLLACPTCMQKIRAPETVLGKQIKCPQCKNPFVAVDSAAPPSTRTIAAREGGSSAPTAVVEAAPAEATSKSWSGSAIAVDNDEFEERSAVTALPAGSSGFVQFLLLKKMAAPRIQVALFYVGLVAILVFGLVALVAAICLTLSRGLERTLGLLLLVGTTLATPLAVVVWRVFCELVATVFRMRDEMHSVDGKTD